LKVYISARAKTRLNEVKDIQKELKDLGHEVAYDWTTSGVKRPYREKANRVHNIEAQAQMLKTAAKADIFIFLDDPGLRGAYVELGAFLTDCLENSTGRKAYIVGPDSHERESVFESPEYVVFAGEIDEVYQDLK
jgi:hypothetical protein